MKTIMKNIILMSLSLLSIQTIEASTLTQDRDSTIFKNKWSIELDPIIPLALRGIDFHVFFAPKKLPRFNFGIAIIAKGNVPDFIINTDSQNKNMGWNYKINQGAGIEFEYYLKEDNNKWFTGFQLFTEEINITNTNEPLIEKHRTNIGMAVARIGYKWTPFKKIGFYLKPWFGLGYTDIISGAFSNKIISNTKVGNYTYHIQPFSPFATIHIGYSF